MAKNSQKCYNHITLKIYVPMNIQQKPSIALVVDVKGWAFYNIATQIVKNLSTDFDFNIYYCGHKNSLYSKEQVSHNVLNLYKASLYEKLFLKKNMI